MAFDPVQEDCHRLVLGAMRRGHASLTDAAFVERCMGLFQNDIDKLIACDKDRSFHLIAKAAELIDYRIPFLADEAEAEREAERAENMVRESCSLDPDNWDAKRVLAALTAASNDEYVQYLLDHLEAIKNDTARRMAAADDVYDQEEAGDLMRRPYLRWLAALSSRLLISGRYRMALDYAKQGLAFSPVDQAGMRFTALLAMAKLECTQEDIEGFRKDNALAFQDPAPVRRPLRKPAAAVDAWTLIAQMSVAYRTFDYESAERMLRTILRTYPRAAECLYCQTEFPDGVYSRVNIAPGSQDELILALSEATPLLQEGLGAPDNAGFATWIATHKLVQAELDESFIRRAGSRAPHNEGEN